jgi:putative DNA methylase
LAELEREKDLIDEVTRRKRIDAWLDAWVVMPNHIHVLIELMAEPTLDEILHSWKSYTSHEANKILRRHGSFWQDDYWDRFIRNQTHYDNAIGYIHQNPVKAGLCKCAEDWPRSSARESGRLAR